MKSSGNIGERIVLARKRKGLSLRALEAAMDGLVSAQAIGKYERGEMIPGSKVLIALAKALDVTIPYLVSPQQARLQNVDFRKKASTTAKERARVEAEVLQAVERYLQIEQILGLPSERWEQPFEPVELDSLEEAEAVAARVRQEWNLGDAPIRDLTELLEEKGIKVLLLDLPETVSGLTCMVQREGHPDVPVIVVNHGHVLERRRHTLAHELAHRLVIGSEEWIEKAMDRIAGAVLVPEAPVLAELGRPRQSVSYREIMLLKRHFRVSAISLWVRLYRLQIIGESTYQNAYRTFARTWRKDEPEALESEPGTLEQPNRFQRLCFRALSEGLISLVKAAELLQMPVDQVVKGWRGPGPACGLGPED